MTYPVWEAGKLYLPGALIQPATATASTPQTLTNAGFESGDTNWTKGTGWTITQAAQTVAGTWSAKFNGGSPSSIICNTQITVTPGQSVSMSCQVYLTTGNSPSSARSIIEWYTSGNALISYSTGSLINSGAGTWRTTSCTATAPATAAYAKVGVNANKNSGQGTIFADGFTVTAPTPAVTTSGLVFRAVQANPGLSGSTEPTWPTVNGNQVIDNQVTWEAVNATRVVWKATPVMVSGGVEPTWPTTPGAVVVDGSIAWECRSTHISDSKCPRSKVVAIVATKVFAADGDIVRFSATANPLDWSTEQDAGYLPTGLQQANANDIAVLNQYRSHLVAMNASSFQMWQVDPDPTNMAILDQMDGVGSTFQGAAQPIANELVYLSQRGVRSIGVAGATENMQAGDIGSPIDPIVQDFLKGKPSSALSTYYPGAGQYWLCADAASGGVAGMYLTGDAPDTTIGADYSYTYRATGGVTPITYAITSGALPTGLTMSSAGVITGKATTLQTQSFTVTATDANGRTASVADVIAVLEALAGLLCHFDAMDGGNIKSSIGPNLAPIPGAGLGGTIKFGSNAGLLVSGSSAWQFTATGVTGVSFNDAWRIDAWVRGTSAVGLFRVSTLNNTHFVSLASPGPGGKPVNYTLSQTGGSGSSAGGSGSPINTSGTVWNHVALQKEAGSGTNNLSGYINGVRVIQLTVDWPASSMIEVVEVGGSTAGGHSIDEVRLSKDAMVAPYGATYIMPSEPYLP